MSPTVSFVPFSDAHITTILILNQALYALHKCGWVHGDVSANNILLHNGVAKIADLEYAKKQDAICEHDRIVSSTFKTVNICSLTTE